jgi:electron transport complex protein RnfE
MGLGFTLALVLLATFREIIGCGSFCGVKLFGDSYTPISIVVSAPGAFIMLGTLIAAVNKIMSKASKPKKVKEEKKEEEVAING